MNSAIHSGSRDGRDRELSSVNRFTLKYLPHQLGIVVRNSRIVERFLLAVFPRLLGGLVRVLGATWRFEVVTEGGVDPILYGQKPGPEIYCFWHQCVLPCTVYFTHSYAVILVSRSFDGELVTRFLMRFGYDAVRGSSSSHAQEGLLGLKHAIETGRTAIFTADGPRGPIYRTKAGPIKLAQVTGAPIGVFHLEPERAWTLPSWDRFLIPKPFTRICVSWAQGVSVPPELSDKEFNAKREELNAAIERARQNARAYLKKSA